MSLATEILCAPAAFDIILADCQDRYPNEACGILIGIDTPAGRQIIEARPAANVWDSPDEQHRRYRLDPAAQLAAERDAAAAGLAVVGFYHSHPDAPPKPSPRDAEAAWPFYTYLIVEVTAAGPGEVRCWIFNEKQQAFDEQTVRPATINPNPAE